MTISIQHEPLKRAFDLCFSFCALVLLIPIFPLLALLIKLSSEGPIFYQSLRLGRGGKIFTCWKFRTMYEDAPEKLQYLLNTNPEFYTQWQINQKVKNDPRITPIGKFLRKTSLDELPQFWNVLKGDLSVVGPRPIAFFGKPEQGLHEIRELAGQKIETILSVRPGVTGLWQISGRGELTLQQRFQIDAEYVQCHTFRQDLMLILKTIPTVLLAKGAS